MLKFVLAIIALAVIFFVAFAVGGARNPEIQGTEACKDAIRSVSKNPSTVSFSFGLPHREDAYRDGKPLGLRLVWERDQLQMQNGFGAMLGTRAECIIDPKTGAVIDLQIQ